MYHSSFIESNLNDPLSPGSLWIPSHNTFRSQEVCDICIYDSCVCLNSYDIQMGTNKYQNEFKQI